MVEDGMTGSGRMTGNMAMYADLDHHQPPESHENPNVPSVVNQLGISRSAPGPPDLKLKFKPGVDALLLDLKNNKALNWKQIAAFPAKSSRTLESGYRRLRGMTTLQAEGQRSHPSAQTRKTQAQEGLHADAQELHNDIRAEQQQAVLGAQEQMGMNMLMDNPAILPAHHYAVSLLSPWCRLHQYTPEEDGVLIAFAENKASRWKQVMEIFPGSSKASFKIRYRTNLKGQQGPNMLQQIFQAQLTALNANDPNEAPDAVKEQLMQSSQEQTMVRYRKMAQHNAIMAQQQQQQYNMTQEHIGTNAKMSIPNLIPARRRAFARIFQQFNLPEGSLLMGNSPRYPWSAPPIEQKTHLQINMHQQEQQAQQPQARMQGQRGGNLEAQEQQALCGKKQITIKDLVQRMFTETPEAEQQAIREQLVVTSDPAQAQHWRIEGIDPLEECFQHQAMQILASTAFGNTTPPAPLANEKDLDYILNMLENSSHPISVDSGDKAVPPHPLSLSVNDLQDSRHRHKATFKFLNEHIYEPLAGADVSDSEQSDSFSIQLARREKKLNEERSEERRVGKECPV